MSAQDQEVEQSSAPLIEHLAELRTRLIRSVGAFVVGIVLAFLVAEPILQFLLAPLEATLRELGDPAPTRCSTPARKSICLRCSASQWYLGLSCRFP